MKPSPRWQLLSSLVLLTVLLPSLTSVQPAQARQRAQTATGDPQPVVSYAVRQDLSPALRNLSPGVTGSTSGQSAPPRLPLPKAGVALHAGSQVPDAALQTTPAQASMPAPDFNFEGINNVNGVLPPDTNGDIGPNHYVQWVNLSLAVWQINRATHVANLVYGPVAGNTLWTGFGGACETTNDGDPIVLYDHLADRWLVSQFALPNFPSSPFYQCIAVSQTPDPTGAWYRYAFLYLANNKMNDYPHFGVWPDGYYMTANQFASNSLNWAGGGAVVYEREKMLLGQAARQVYFDLYDTNPSFGGMLPADLDGPPPPAGTPNYFAEVDDANWIGPSDAMRIWEFHVDWNNTANSTFGLAENPNATLNVATFSPLLTSLSIPQPGTTRRLDNLGDRLMHRLQYRYIDGHETLVANHTVDAGGGRAAVRWYEVRRTSGSWSIYQQGTYAGEAANSEHRWMASAAMDSAGNLALGYSLSSNTVYPSIATAGRLASDLLGTLPQGELILRSGTGHQTHSDGRWGDYSMMGVDPLDGCTFWYTNEYIQISSSAFWQTRVAAFSFPSCLSGQTGVLQGTVLSGSNPLANATLDAGGFTTHTDALGFYQFPDLPVGTYTVTASAYGYQPAQATNVNVLQGSTTSQDFNLTALPMATVSGTVRDGSGQGWPLYARIDVAAAGAAFTTFTNPQTGAYSLTLAQGTAHDFNVTAQVPGYIAFTTSLTPSQPTVTQDFSLIVDSACNAPGYTLSGTCQAQPGGLLVGNVYDLNTSGPLNGAAITSTNASSDVTTAFATPDDPAQDDGLFVLFSSLTGAQDFSASSPGYALGTQTANITSGAVGATDFNLPAGWLDILPPSLQANPSGLQPVTQTLTITNTGSYTASFSIAEVNAASLTLLPSGPYAIPTRHTSPKRQADLTATAVYEYLPPSVPRLPGGQVLRQWTAGLAYPWGVGYDTRQDKLWVGDVALGGGDDRLHGFHPQGAPTGAVIETSRPEVYFTADMAYNPHSGNFWQVNVSGGNCLVEIDPVAHALTGRQICPGFDNSQRGLAYNPLNGSFYSGAWTDGVLYHFDGRGVILDSANLNLNIAGLAFNPDTNHLFVLSNANLGFDVYVIDTANDYAILGGFDIAGMGDFEQAGLSIDCSGNLWAVSQASGEIFAVESNEPTACAFADVPWMAVTPVTGEIPAGEASTIQVVFDPGLANGGLNSAQLTASNDTPYGSQTIPVEMNVDYIYDVGVSPETDARSGASMTHVYYSLQVTNRGNASDAYQISTSDNLWAAIVPAQVGPLLPGNSTLFQVSISIPGGVILGETDRVTVKLSSLSDPLISATAVLTTTVEAGHLFIPILLR